MSDRDGAQSGTIIKVGIEANWVDHRLQRRKETIATANWLVKGCKLAERKPAYFLEEGQSNAGPVVAGWFSAPGPSYRDDDRDGRPDKLVASSATEKPKAAPKSRAVPYRLTIRVTEADESKMKEFLDKARKLLAKQRDRLIKGAGELAKKAAEGD